MFWILSVNGALGKKDLKANSVGGCSAKTIILCSSQEWCVWPDPIENYGSASLELLLHIGPSFGQESWLLKNIFISCVFCLVALLTLIWKQRPGCSCLLLNTQVFVVVAAS